MVLLGQLSGRVGRRRKIFISNPVGLTDHRVFLLIFDELVKSIHTRHSRGEGNPECAEIN